MNDSLAALLAAEEAKRNAAWTPAERWRVIQETIAWADQQRTVRRNTKETALRLQAEKLLQFEKSRRPA
jgi:hypothetical protein